MDLQSILNNPKPIYTKGDYYSFCKSEQKGVIAKLHIGLIVKALSLMAYSLFIYDSIRFMMYDRDIIRMVIIGGFLLLGVCLYYITIKSNLKAIRAVLRGRQKHTFGNQDHIQVCLDAEGVLLYNQMKKITYKWEELKQLTDAKDVIYLVFKESQVVYLPKNFLGNQLDECIQLIKNKHVGKNVLERYLLPNQVEAYEDKPLFEIQSEITEKHYRQWYRGDSMEAFIRKIITFFACILLIHGVGMMAFVYKTPIRMVDKGILALTGLYILYAFWIRPERDVKKRYKTLPDDKCSVHIAFYEVCMIIRSKSLVHYLPYENIRMQKEGKDYYGWRSRGSAYIVDKNKIRNEEDRKLFKKLIKLK